MTADKEVAGADKEVAGADKEVVSADKEVAGADKEVVEMDKEVVGEDKEVVETDKEVDVGCGGGGEELDEGPPDKKWIRFRRPSLSLEESKRLAVVVKNGELPVGEFERTEWRCFGDRVCREYFHLHKKHNKNDKMHLGRENLISSAIAVVLGTVRPRTCRPCDGDKTEIQKVVQPWVEKALQLPGPGVLESEGCESWVDDVIKSGDYTFRHCSENRSIMLDFLSKQIPLTKTGFPEKCGKVPGPDVLYNLSTTRVGMPRSKVNYIYYDTHL